MERDPQNDSRNNYERVLGHALKQGEITASEVLTALAAYDQWIATGNSGLVAIEDGDTLASPIGYYDSSQSVLD